MRAACVRHVKRTLILCVYCAAVSSLTIALKHTYTYYGLHGAHACILLPVPLQSSSRVNYTLLLLMFVSYTLYLVYSVPERTKAYLSIFFSFGYSSHSFVSNVPLEYGASFYILQTIIHRHTQAYPNIRISFQIQAVE